MNKEPATYQQQAYEYIREQIITLSLKPGEYITDALVAECLKISRTPVREAFQRLERGAADQRITPWVACLHAGS